MIRAKNYLLLLGIFLIAVTIDAQSISIKKSINSNWKFIKNQTDQIDELPTENWKYVNLPHTWNDNDVLDDEPGYYQGNGWYKRDFFVPSYGEEKRIFVLFEGANQVTSVYINNNFIGQHKGGYTAFTFDITEQLLFGQTNQILVKVNNEVDADIPPLSGDFTFYGGIYRDVWIIEKEPIHFDFEKYADSGILISTPEVNKDFALVNIKGLLSNKSTEYSELQIDIKIKDPSNKTVFETISQIELPAGFKKEFSINDLKITSPILWSLKTPNLYRVSVILKDKQNDRVLDEVENPLGFRFYHFDPDEGFFLNGEPLKIIGVSRHQDYANIGNGLSNELHVKDVELIKEMGANFLRIAHYPQDPSILETCDRLGILASVETPLVNDITLSDSFFENSHNMMKEMIFQNYNHPSVIAWCYMNEILLGYKRKTKNDPNAYTSNYFSEVKRLASEMDSISKALDSERYTMIVNHGELDLYSKAGLSEVADLNAWNLYHGWYSENFENLDKHLDEHYKKFPNTPLLIGEYGAGVDPRLRSEEPIRFDFTHDWAVKYHKYYVDAMNKRPFVSGGFVWNFADFGSEFRVDAVPHINNKGLVGIDRVPKDVYYWYKAILNEKPVVEIGSKNWTKRTGVSLIDEKITNQTIEVYSNLDSVYLIHNGNSSEWKELVENVANFQIKFENGSNFVRAIGISDGEEIIDQVTIEFEIIPYNLKEYSNWNLIAVNLGDHRNFYDPVTRINWLPDKKYESGNWGFMGGEVYYKKSTFQSQTFKQKNVNSNQKNDISKNLKIKFGSEKNILGTENDPLFQSQRQGFDSYRFDVNDGKYEIEFYLAELEVDSESKELIYNLGNDQFDSTSPAERIFDILINDKVIFPGINLAKNIGAERAEIYKTEVLVKNDSGITIKLNSGKIPGFLNAILLRKIL
ncbi:MAG: hypothetical protein K9J12_17970 [Melioribacteraceae bacterium]|nr:hypothetical protein [Melioribacteraceae bacterium]MCF8264198.1 hypothetical protein [Melioribacteraceae bacterium]